jgi:hypothetical protein
VLTRKKTFPRADAAAALVGGPVVVVVGAEVSVLSTGELDGASVLTGDLVKESSLAHVVASKPRLSLQANSSKSAFVSSTRGHGISVCTVSTKLSTDMIVASLYTNTMEEMFNCESGELMKQLFSIVSVPEPV